MIRSTRWAGRGMWVDSENWKFTPNFNLDGGRGEIRTQLNNHRFLRLLCPYLRPNSRPIGDPTGQGSRPSLSELNRDSNWCALNVQSANPMLDTDEADQVNERPSL